ncbi:hypothetical protein HGA88_03020 [Candidatus Roizmanbacteria bacterium]|nr:hypothetical protein [Candidatus Roizmanbacteria bacterium]
MAFIVTLGIVIYEIKRLKDQKKMQSVPVIPQLDQTVSTEPKTIHATPLKMPHKIGFLQSARFHSLLLPLLIIMLLVFGVITFWTGNKEKTASEESNGGSVTVQEVRSAGIRLFDRSFTEIDKKDWNNLKPGSTIVIGVASIADGSIDRARIRVNETVWTTEHITLQFEKKYQVFYKEYTIPEGVKSLKIDAQLHTAQDGWLGT